MFKSSASKFEASAVGVHGSLLIIRCLSVRVEDPRGSWGAGLGFREKRDLQPPFLQTLNLFVLRDMVFKPCYMPQY